MFGDYQLSLHDYLSILRRRGLVPDIAAEPSPSPDTPPPPGNAPPGP